MTFKSSAKSSTLTPKVEIIESLHGVKSERNLAPLGVKLISLFYFLSSLLFLYFFVLDVLASLSCDPTVDISCGWNPFSLGVFFGGFVFFVLLGLFLLKLKRLSVMHLKRY